MLKIIKQVTQSVMPGPWTGARFGAGLYQVLRLALGGLFVYAGLTKILDPRAFAHTIAQFDLVPDQALPLLAVGLPSLELLAGVGLIFEVRGSLTVIAALLGLFLLALGYAVLLEMDIDCGCFTVAELNAKSNVRQALVRDLFLAAVVALLYVWRRYSANCASKSIDCAERRKS